MTARRECILVHGDGSVSSDVHPWSSDVIPPHAVPEPTPLRADHDPDTCTHPRGAGLRWLHSSTGIGTIEKIRCVGSAFSSVFRRPYRRRSTQRCPYS